MLKLWTLIAAVALLNAENTCNYSVVDEMQDLTTALVMTYFSEALCVGVVTEGPGSVHLRKSQLPVFYIALNTSSSNWDHLLLPPINAGCLAFIIQVHDPKIVVETFSDLFRLPPTLYRANRRFVYLPQGEEGSWEAMMKDVFSSRAMNWMPDLLVLNVLTGKDVTDKINFVKQEDDNKRRATGIYEKVQAARHRHTIPFLIEIYTHTFVGSNHFERIRLDVWVPGHGFMHSVDLFPDKVQNLMGKELKTMSIPYSPYTVMMMDAEPPVYDGIEFQAVFEYGRKHNITWDIHCDVVDWWGEIWDNGSGNGIYGSTSSDRVDLGFSAVFMLFREFSYFDYSVPFYQSGLTAVAPRPKPLSTWLIPVRPFNSYMWCAVLVSTVAVTVALYIVSTASHAVLGGNVASRYSTLTECGFRSLGLLVLQVPDDERDYATPRYTPLRHLVSWCILFFLVLSSAYGGGLASVLTIPGFQPPIDTAQDLADSGLHWCALHLAYILSLQGSTDPVSLTLMENFRVHTMEELIQLAYDDNSALLQERMQGGHFTDMKYVFEGMMETKRIMKEDVITEHSVYVFRKGSPYKESLNAFLLMLRQSGIPIFWETITVLKFQSQRLQISIRESRSPPDIGQKKLAFQHVQGAFFLLALGLLLALVTLFLELLRYRCTGKKNKEKLLLQRRRRTVGLDI